MRFVVFYHIDLIETRLPTVKIDYAISNKHRFSTSVGMIKGTPR